MEEESAKNSISIRLRHAIELCAPTGDEADGEKWSLKVFSKETEIPYRTLQDYLSGARLPGADALQKMAKKGIDINWVLLGDSSGSPIKETDVFPEADCLPLNDKEAEELIKAMALDWSDKVNKINIQKTGSSLPALAILQLIGHFRLHATVSYMRTINAVPLYLEKGMTKFDMLKVIESAVEPYLSQEADNIMRAYANWTTAISAYVSAHDDHR